MDRSKFENFKNKVVSTKNLVVAETATAIMMAIPNVMAADEGKDTMKKLIKVILPYIAIVGIPLIVVGGFKLVQAFRNDQGDAIPSAAKDIAIGIILTLFGTIGESLLDAI